MKTADIQAWFNKIQIVTDADNLGTNERMQLESLLGHKGMETFLGLMLGSRQAELIKLSRLALGDVERAHLASVTQGKIQGIDQIWQTLLELAVPEQATAEGART